MLMKGKAEVQVQTVEGYLDMMSDLRALAKKGILLSMCLCERACV